VWQSFARRARSQQETHTARSTKVAPNTPSLSQPLPKHPNAKFQLVGPYRRCSDPAQPPVAASERAHQHTSAIGCACCPTSCQARPTTQAAANPCSSGRGVGLALPGVPAVRVSGFVCPSCLATPPPRKAEGRTWTGCGHARHSQMHTCTRSTLYHRPTHPVALRLTGIGARLSPL